MLTNIQFLNINLTSMVHRFPHRHHIIAMSPQMLTNIAYVNAPIFKKFLTLLTIELPSGLNGALYSYHYIKIVNFCSIHIIVVCKVDKMYNTYTILVLIFVKCFMPFLY